MAGSIKSKYEPLLAAISAATAENSKIAQAGEEAFSLLNCWLEYFGTTHSENEAAELLNAAYSAAVETVSLTYLGLLRPAVFSLRGTFEFLLMFLYYKDHPIEWRARSDQTDHSKLPAEIEKYLAKYYPLFSKRLAKLSKKKGSSVDVYDVMSAIAHGTVSHALPYATLPVDVVANPDSLKQIGMFIQTVAEYLSDVCAACHDGNWSSLPALAQQDLKTRLGKKAAKELWMN